MKVKLNTEITNINELNLLFIRKFFLFAAFKILNIQTIEERAQIIPMTLGPPPCKPPSLPDNKKLSFNEYIKLTFERQEK